MHGLTSHLHGGLNPLVQLHQLLPGRDRPPLSALLKVFVG